ncbi:MAG: hypothetical protein ABR593_01905, partial [Candidatus Limnocylindria bacterium]
GSVSEGAIEAGLCSASHSYSTAGSYTVTVTVSDDDDGSSSDSVAISIAEVAFELGVAVSWPSGSGGTVTSDPAGIECPPDCSELYADGTVVTLTATPEPGSVFTGWSGDCDGSSTCQVTMSATRSVGARFDPIPVTHSLSVARDGDGSGTVTSDPAGISCGDDCAEDYPDGTSVTLSATADPGSTFTGWSGAGCEGSSTCVVSMSEARSVTASFDVEPDPTADLSVHQEDTPDPVTAGNAVQYFITVTNNGPDAATNVMLVNTLPANSTLISSSTPGCSTAGGTVTCNLGTLAAEASANVSIVVGAPNTSSATTMTNTAVVSATELDPNTADNTDAEVTNVHPAPDDPDAAAGWIPATGETVTTGGGNGPSKKDPMTTAVTVPAGFPGLVTIVEGPITGCATGFRCFGQEATISAPTTTVETPLRLTFRFHSSTLPGGTQPHEIVMFHDNALVERCTDTSGIAEPDPCISSVARIKGVMTVVVLSSENGTWRGGK